MLLIDFLNAVRNKVAYASTCAINVPSTVPVEEYARQQHQRLWIVESGGEDYGDYKIARFDFYVSGYNVKNSFNYSAIDDMSRWIKKESWKICRLGDFDIYSMTCSPPRFVRQLNDCRQLRAITITIKYNERSD